MEKVYMPSGTPFDKKVDETNGLTLKDIIAETAMVRRESGLGGSVRKVQDKHEKHMEEYCEKVADSCDDILEQVMIYAMAAHSLMFTIYAIIDAVNLSSEIADLDDDEF